MFESLEPHSADTPPGGNNPATEVRERLLLLCLYMGIAPLFWGWSKNQASARARVHYGQALALWALFGLFWVLFAGLVIFFSILMIHQRVWAESRAGEVWILGFARKCLLVWVVFWLFSAWRCLRGSAIPVPFLGAVARRSLVRCLGIGVVHFLFFGAIAIIPGAWYADAMVADTPEAGKVFVLYDDMGFIPRPLFSLATCRLSRASVKRWGKESLVLAPLNRENINLALMRGRLVFIGSHGVSEGLLLSDGYYSPEDVPAQPVESDLGYVYLAGCDSGAQREAWEAALHPATVKTYDRLTPTLEHLWWLWTAGPRLIRDFTE